MAKPIFLVGLEWEVAPSAIEPIRNSLVRQLPDYFVIVYFSRAGQHFQVLNADNLTELQFEELKTMVEEIVSREKPIQTQ